MPAPLTRLLMSADAVGGVWTYAVDLAQALVPHGVATTLAVLGPAASDDQRAAARAVAGLRLIETGAPLDWLADTAAGIAGSARDLADLAREEAADLVHLNSPALAALARWPAPVLGVCHSCLAIWWNAMHASPMPPDFAWRSAMLARGYAACDGLVAPSAAFADATRSVYGVRPFVVHNGAAPRCSADIARNREVLTAGRLWDDAKNLITLDRAAGLLDAPVFAAGALTGPSGEYMAPRYVQPLGQLSPSALRIRMSRAPVFASLARYEPFGLTVLEAAQSGCALVLSDIPSFRELWTDAAVFVPPNDHQAAAAALQDLLDDPQQAATAGRAARARAGRYDIAATAHSMLARYRALPARKRAA